MTHDPADAGNSTPAQKAMKQTAKMPPVAENEDADPVGAGDKGAPVKRRVREGDKPVGQSENDGSSPYEEPHHIAKQQRDQ